MRRASRGRLEVPGSRSEVEGKGGFMLVVVGVFVLAAAAAAAAVVVAVAVEVPFVSCEAGGWVVGCWVDCEGGLGCGAVVVAGGVEMPFCIGSAVGEAMVD